MRRARHFARDRESEIGGAGIVDHHRIVAAVAHLGLGAVQAGDALGDLDDALLQEVARFRLERARGTAQQRGLRDHVVGEAGLEQRDRDHRALERIDVARNDLLQGADDLGPDQHGIDREMRPRGVAADALDLDGERGRPRP